MLQGVRFSCTILPEAETLDLSQCYKDWNQNWDGTDCSRMAKEGLAEAGGKGTEEAMFELPHALGTDLTKTTGTSATTAFQRKCPCPVAVRLLLGPLAVLVARRLPRSIGDAARSLADGTGDFVRQAADTLRSQLTPTVQPDLHDIT